MSHALRLTALLVGGLLIGLADMNSAAAQQNGPARLRNQESDQRPRRANDSVEGAIFEFEIKATSEEEQVSGQFRVEGDGVFDTRTRIDLGEGGNLRERVGRVVRGEGTGEIELPNAEAPRRIGDIRRLDDGKLRIDFHTIAGDESSLDGMMIIWKKEAQGSVWMGYYRPHIDPNNANRLGDKRDVELRTAED